MLQQSAAAARAGSAWLAAPGSCFGAGAGLRRAGLPAGSVPGSVRRGPAGGGGPRRGGDQQSICQLLLREAQAGRGEARLVAAGLCCLNSGTECVPYTRARRGLGAGPGPRLRRGSRLLRQRAHALPGERCVPAGPPAADVRQCAALRRPDEPLPLGWRALLPLRVPGRPRTVTHCADGGVLGGVPGVLGCLQALEVLKIAAGLWPSYSGSMLLFEGLGGHYSRIRLQHRCSHCVLCGQQPTVTCLQNYEAFCGSLATDKCLGLKLLSLVDRISVTDYKWLLDVGTPHVLLDVLPQLEVDFCPLQHPLHIPLNPLERGDADSLKLLGAALLDGKRDSQEGAAL